MAGDDCFQMYGLPRWLRGKEFACNVGEDS